MLFVFWLIWIVYLNACLWERWQKISNVENNACTNIMNASNPSDPSLVFILVGCNCSMLEVLEHWTWLFRLWRVLGSNFHTSFFSIIVNQWFVFRIFEWMGYCVGAIICRWFLNFCVSTLFPSMSLKTLLVCFPSSHGLLKLFLLPMVPHFIPYPLPEIVALHK